MSAAVRSGQSVMFLIERAIEGHRRTFIVDCPHGTTDLTVDNFPLPDRARSAAVFGNLIPMHRKAMKQSPDRFDCKCETPKSLSS